MNARDLGFKTYVLTSIIFTVACGSERSDRRGKSQFEDPVVACASMSFFRFVDKETCYESRDGLRITEGDILVNDHPQSYDDEQNLIGASIGPITETSGYWIGGQVPYVIAGANANVVVGAINRVNSTLPVRFVPRTSEPAFVSFESYPDPNMGLSALGRVGGKQTISLGANTPEYIAMHEMIHAIGFAHEQMRKDRDQYITVYYQNIPTAWHSQFVPYFEPVGSYDPSSIMHYSSLTFSINPLRDPISGVVAPGNGSAIAKWQFSDLIPGKNYDVYLSWRAHPSHASNVPVQILDGIKLIASVTVNQQSGTQDLNRENIGFAKIASITTTTGSLQINLSNNANGYVAADAVLLLPKP